MCLLPTDSSSVTTVKYATLWYGIFGNDPQINCMLSVGASWVPRNSIVNGRVTDAADMFMGCLCQVWFPCLAVPTMASLRMSRPSTTKLVRQQLFPEQYMCQALYDCLQPCLCCLRACRYCLVLSAQGAEATELFQLKRAELVLLCCVYWPVSPQEHMSRPQQSVNHA